MANQVLGQFLDDFAVIGLLLTFAYVMIAKTISATGIFGAISAFFTIKNKGLEIESKAYLALKTAAIIAFITMALIIVKVFVLSGRYVTALSWILLSLGAFYFAQLLQTQNKKYAFIASAVMVALVIGLVKNILPKQAGYNYMQEAVVWLKANNHNQQPVFYEESRMRYYAQAPFIGTFGEPEGLLQLNINNHNIAQYEYLVLNYNRERPERIAQMQQNLPDYQEIKRFYGQKNKKAVIIYRKKTQ